MSILSSTSSGKAKVDAEYEKYGLDPAKVTITEHGSIDYDGDVDFSKMSLNKIPFIFNKVTGNFLCGPNELTTLKGCPKNVGGYFYCGYNLLTDLKGAPQIVGSDFNCSNNLLLKSLKGAPKKASYILCENCLIKSLKSLKDSNIKGLRCNYNAITSLEGCPKELHTLDCSNNIITTLNGCPKTLIRLNCEYNYLTIESFMSCHVRVKQQVRCLTQMPRSNNSLSNILDDKKIKRLTKAKNVY